MKISHKFILVPALLIAVFAVSAVPAAAATSPQQSGFAIIPCGGVNNPCTFDDLVKTAIRLINYLFAVAGIIAAYHIVTAGWGMMSALGNAEKLTNARQGLTYAVMGFAIVLLSFAFINLLLGIFGITCEWWRPGNLFCLYGA